MTFGRNDSTIEFVCFSFHESLLVIMQSPLKLHTENNACMFLLLTGSVTRNFLHYRWCNLGRILNK